MASQKLEDLLNLALSATKEEREQSDQLNVGYNERENTWELIVKFHGDIEMLASVGIVVEILIPGYAVLTVPESQIDFLSRVEEIEYIEKPKRLYFQLQEGKEASCILPVTGRPPYLTGRGVIVGIADSGIDLSHEEFRNPDGTTRILALWDQTLVPDEEAGLRSPWGFQTGVEFTADQINEALTSGMTGRMTALPTRDISGHGTSVAAIAAGNQGVAPQSDLLVVRLGIPAEEGFPRTTELMRAVTYMIRKAVALGRPIAINLSFGNTYGSHDGTSLLERFLDNAAEIGRTVICVGSGNEGAAMGHASGRALTETRVELSVGNYERAFGLQIWKNYADVFRILLTSPGGESRLIDTGRTADIGQTRRERMEDTELLLYLGEPAPYSVQQEVYIDFLPVERYVNPGVWTITFVPVSVVTGSYSMYLPSVSSIGSETHFFAPTPEVTLTIPSTSSKVITVGAYDTAYDAYADFSGRGYLFGQSSVDRIGSIFSKPDLAAPGVGIVTAAAEGGYVSVTGTSFATPFVTGSAALMMEWGIVIGNDPYLYGEKVKAYLSRGARHLPGIAEYPNPLVGWGALCLERSLPI